MIPTKPSPTNPQPSSQPDNKPTTETDCDDDWITKRICAEEHPGYELCSRFPYPTTYPVQNIFGPRAIPYNKADIPKYSTCGAGKGTHTNFRRKGEGYLGSLLCCECCYTDKGYNSHIITKCLESYENTPDKRTWGDWFDEVIEGLEDIGNPNPKCNWPFRPEIMA